MSLVAEARTAVLSELALGIAHALNNALTSIGGEASFLQSETKDPAVEEGSRFILEQVERCARLTHALLRRRAPPAHATSECELGRVLRDVEALLRDSLPRRIELAFEACDAAVLVALPADEAETIVLLLVQRAALRAEGGAALRLRLPDPGPHAVVTLELSAAGAMQDGPASALHDRLLGELVAARGGTLAFASSDGEERARVSLPRLSE